MVKETTTTRPDTTHVDVPAAVCPRGSDWCDADLVHPGGHTDDPCMGHSFSIDEDAHGGPGLAGLVMHAGGMTSGTVHVTVGEADEEIVLSWRQAARLGTWLLTAADAVSGSGQ